MCRSHRTPSAPTTYVVISQPGMKRNFPGSLKRAAISAIVLIRTSGLPFRMRHFASGKADLNASKTDGSTVFGGHVPSSGATRIQRSGSAPMRLWSVIEKKS